MEKIYAFVNRFLENIMALLMLFIVLLLFSEVIGRYVLNSPISWAEEMATYAFIWMIYIGSGVAFYRHAHIRVDYISYKLTPETMKKIELGLNLIMAFFFIFLLVMGLRFAIPNLHADSYTLPVIKLGWIYAAVPIGALLMLCNVARNLFLITRSEKSHSEG
jgi:TRAP-type C4-dicarboxylate transport system permease small subunit